MRKAFIIIVLFALPVTIYIIFGTAVHHFVHLPVLTEEVDPIENYRSLEDQDLQFEDFVTVLCFYGNDIAKLKGNAYNLHEKIYKENYIYKDFQMIIVAEDGSQEEAQNLLDELHDFTGINVSKWKFLFTSPEKIQKLFNSLETDLSLNENLATPYAFVIDKELGLRGRKKNAKDTDRTLYGYETSTIAALNNTMVDDINVLLAEYRFKMKREEESFLKFDKKQ
ncbi:MAG TPA: hypothetical protein VK021_07640 [Flavobacteriaceae bacterium]|nr:hypothetical protein [Flavobacteriaceae bacterium]